MGREYARKRLQQQDATGAILSDGERAALRSLIGAAEEEGTTEVIGEIEHAIIVYWHMMHDADDDDRAKLDRAARLGAEYLRALRDLPPHHLATIAGSESPVGSGRDQTTLTRCVAAGLSYSRSISPRL